MASMLNETMGSAKEAMESAKAGTEHAYSSTRSVVMDGVHLLAGIAPFLRGFTYDGMLSHVGLARRRSPFEGAAIFGAGMMVGAGIGVLFAPMSGDSLRKKLFATLKGGANEAVERVESGVKQVEEKAEDLADKAKSAAMKTEKKVERKIEDGAHTVNDAVKQGTDAVKQGTDAAAGALKHAASDAKSYVSAASNGTNGANDDKTPKAQRSEGPAHRSS